MERLERFLRTRDPRALWPELTDADLTTARYDLERVARSVLGGARDVPLNAATQRHSAYAMTIAAFTTGTGALIGRWIEAGRVQAGDADRAVFAHELRQARRRAERVDVEALPAFDGLLARGITPVVIKGFHTAHAYWEEPALRPFADIDLVVPADRVSDAEGALREAGFRATTGRTTHPYEQHWIAARADPRQFSVEGIDPRSRWEIDLHASFDRSMRASTARLDGERHALVPFPFAGRSLLAPAQPLLLHVLALQIAQDLKGMRLMRVLDLVRVIRADVERGVLDWDAVLAMSSRAGVARYTYPALALAEQLAPGTVDARVLAAAAAASTPLARRVVRGLRPVGTTFDRTNVAALFMWARSPFEALGVSSHLVADAFRYGGRDALGLLRALARRLRRGALHFRGVDERHGGATPAVRRAAAESRAPDPAPPSPRAEAPR